MEPVLLSGFISANSPREGLGFNSPTFRQINVVYLALSLQSNLARTCILCQGDNLLADLSALLKNNYAKRKADKINVRGGTRHDLGTQLRPGVRHEPFLPPPLRGDHGPC